MYAALSANTKISNLKFVYNNCEITGNFSKLTSEYLKPK